MMDYDDWRSAHGLAEPSEYVYGKAKERTMEDTDWRPSACLSCGKLRNAAQYPVCENKECKDYGLYTEVGMGKEERTMTMKTEPKRYVWIRANGDATIIDTDIVELWQSPSFDRKKDRIYELGAEVEIKVTVAVNNKPVYRERSYQEGTR